jgi:hypothetical protein
MNLLENLKSMLSDGVNGSVSSKRVITFLATFLVALAFVLNLFWSFTVAGLGTTVAEKFAKK